MSRKTRNREPASTGCCVRGSPSRRTFLSTVQRPRPTLMCLCPLKLRCGILLPHTNLAPLHSLHVQVGHDVLQCLESSRLHHGSIRITASVIQSLCSKVIRLHVPHHMLSPTAHHMPSPITFTPDGLPSPQKPRAQPRRTSSSSHIWILELAKTQQAQLVVPSCSLIGYSQPHGELTFRLVFAVWTKGRLPQDCD